MTNDFKGIVDEVLTKFFGKLVVLFHCQITVIEVVLHIGQCLQSA